jgi:hypothetical protein
MPVDYVKALFLFFTYFFWLITYLIKEDLKNFYSNHVKTWFLMIWFAIAGALILGYSVFSMSTTWELNVFWY